MAGDAPVSAGTTTKPDPMELAKNIGKNVETALNHPDNARALEALHRDAQVLDYRKSPEKSNAPIDRTALQNAVQDDLVKLGFGRIDILPTGEIQSYQGLPDFQGNFDPAETSLTPNFRSLSATPDGPTKLEDVTDLGTHPSW